VGLLWRLFAPKPLKKARRTVRRATHPVGLITPKPVKKVRHAISTVAHPIEAAEFAVENQIVRAVRGGGRRSTKAQPTRSDGLPARFTQEWIERTMPRLDRQQAAHVISVMRARGWSDDELRRRVLPYVRH
jgi:hypothetical protein